MASFVWHVQGIFPIPEYEFFKSNTYVGRRCQNCVQRMHHHRCLVTQYELRYLV